MSVVEDETSAPTERPVADEPVRRGWATLYAVAFGLMLGAGVALAASSLGSLRSMGLLWLSGSLSIGAIAVAVVSLFVPRRP
ncbi:MAG TPA: hypothetical protein VFK59_11340 [Actinomycetota bacterium]|nr:hypothetical protein [Actinomycetota bacterium]